MLKITFAAVTLISLTACMDIDGSAQKNKFEGSTSGCENRSAISQQYMQSVNGLAVRCGPQSVLPVTYR